MQEECGVGKGRRNGRVVHQRLCAGTDISEWHRVFSGRVCAAASVASKIAASIAGVDPETVDGASDNVLMNCLGPVTDR